MPTLPDAKPRCRVCGITNENTGPCPACADTRAYSPCEKRGMTAEFFTGIGYCVKGTKLILKNPPLIAISAIPIVITTAIFVLIFWFGGGWISDTLAGWTANWPGWLRTVVDLGGWIGFTVIYLLIGFFLFGIVGMLTAIPFLDWLSGGIEKAYLGHAAKGDASSLAVFRQVALLQLFKLAIVIPLFALNFVPVLGTVVYYCAWSYLTALDFMDIPMSRKDYTLNEKRLILRSFRVRIMGFGIAAFLLTALPVLCVFTFPVGAGGATLMFLDMRKNSDDE